MKLNETQLYTIVHALRVAADTYQADMGQATRANDQRIASQFEKQMHEAAQLANEIEAAETVLIG